MTLAYVTQIIAFLFQNFSVVHGTESIRNIKFKLSKFTHCTNQQTIFFTDYNHVNYHIMKVIQVSENT